MSARLVVTILGCGASPGVPRIGPDWGACDPNEPKNMRTRCSILIEQYGEAPRPTRVLVDTGPDMRMQLINARVNTLDAVVYTHAHADHLHGIDDLRAIWLEQRRPIDVYADAPTGARLLEAFRYCFERPPSSGYPSILKLNPITIGAPLTVEGAGGAMTLHPFRQAHGDIDTVGLRVGGMAYSCDVSDVPPESLPALAGLDVWIVDALRHSHHPSHFSVSQALAWIERIRPKRAVLTHMHSDLDYRALHRALPPHVEPAFDGMQLTLPLP